jgi:protein involved in polysaccharide export with SLBB domain
VITFDYQKYLDTGDSRILPSLRPLDEIFIPSSPLTGNVQIDFDSRTLAAAGDAAEDRKAIRVFGEVNQPGSFAFRPGMTVMDALLRAGGVTRYASVDQVRVIANNQPQLFNLKSYLDSGRTGLNPVLVPGTTIFVPKETDEVQSGAHVVYVMGEVAKPGAFEARPGASFFDILANAGGPTRFADSRQIRIIRGGGGVTDFDLSAYTEGGGHTTPPTISPGDAIFVPEKVQGPEQSSWLRIPPDRSVRVIGEVRAPGRLEWSDEMSLVDLIAQAGGPTEHGDLANVTVLTSDAGGRATTFDLKHFLERGGPAGSLPVVHSGYTVTVPALPQSPNDTRSTWVEQPASRSIYVLGSVGHPGRYAFDPGLSFLDVLSAADGPTPSADLLNIRVSHRGEARERVSHVDLAAYLESGDEHLLPEVKPGDVIFVPDRNRNWLEESPRNTVRILGAVGKPGRYQVSGDMTILDLLAEAGGPTSEAYEEKIVVVNLSCCASQARLFNLVAFAKTGDFSRLPVVRPGDTVYVPTLEQSDWKIFMDNVRDAVSILSIFGLFKVLL